MSPVPATTPGGRGRASEESSKACDELGRFSARNQRSSCYKRVGMLPVPMTGAAPSSPHSLATASGLLPGTLGVAVCVGALVGGLVGAWESGLLAGAIAGIPLAVAVVYVVYARAGSWARGGSGPPP